MAKKKQEDRTVQASIATWGEQSDIKTFRRAMVCVNCQYCHKDNGFYKDVCVRQKYIQIESHCVCDDFEWRRVKQ